MAEAATQAIELIRRIIADDTADLRERVQHIEQKITSDVERTEFVDNQPSANPDIQEALDKLGTKASKAEAALELIKELHKLDATPVQWTRGDQGKMVEAPPGLWEIACVACNHKTVWREGDKQPPQCKTWRIANGESV